MRDMKDFDAVWASIKAHEGEEFRQIRGARFSYVVDGSTLTPDRTSRGLSRSQFEKAWARMPLADTTTIQDLQGPSYLFAILTDPRIR